jgi:hypothetical protein
MTVDNVTSEKDILTAIRSYLTRIADSKQKNRRGLLFNLSFFVAYICLMLILVWVYKGDSGFSDFFKHLTEQPVYLRVASFFAFCWFVELILHTVFFFRSWQSAINDKTLQSALKYVEKKQQELMSTTICPEINTTKDKNNDKK